MPSGAHSVCRFYDQPSAGLDAHFYTASAQECAEVAQRFAGVWLLKTGNAFGIGLPGNVLPDAPDLSRCRYSFRVAMIRVATTSLCDADRGFYCP